MSWSAYADAARCSADDEVCRRVHALEPLLPIAPPFDPTRLTPCLRSSGKVACVPAVQILGGWHSFAEEALQPLLEAHPKIAFHGKYGETCFNDWEEDGAKAGRWFGGWGLRPKDNRLLVQQCVHLLSFYPAYPNGYLRAFLREYWPCKAEAVKALKASGRHEGEYYRGAMWSQCRPRAIAAHDAATGTGGLGHELTPPFVMRSVYGPRPPKLVALLRDPIDRLETSFWAHPHYPKRYGASAEGLHAYVTEQVAGFRACEARHGGVRRCCFLFEMLDKAAADVFFHADQVIRGIYHPFAAEWHAAFPSSLLVLRAEDLLDAPLESRARLFGFIGLDGGGGGGGKEERLARRRRRSYAEQHAASLAEAEGREPGAGPPPPMLAATRSLLFAFYRPHNERLAALLGDRRLEWAGGNSSNRFKHSI